METQQLHQQNHRQPTDTRRGPTVMICNTDSGELAILVYPNGSYRYLGKEVRIRETPVTYVDSDGHIHNTTKTSVFLTMKQIAHHSTGIFSDPAMPGFIATIKNYMMANDITHYRIFTVSEHALIAIAGNLPELSSPPLQPLSTLPSRFR